VRRFPNDAEVPQNRILKQCLSHKICRGLSGGVSLDSFEGAEYVLEESWARSGCLLIPAGPLPEPSGGISAEGTLESAQQF
jgi:hypothetical protein